jgi:hypothetical protein
VTDLADTYPQLVEAWADLAHEAYVALEQSLGLPPGAEADECYATYRDLAEQARAVFQELVTW